jgi:uncharacterized protein YabN with tetrapyrrole methylase and pyrophosphatase domain
MKFDAFFLALISHLLIIVFIAGCPFDRNQEHQLVVKRFVERD